MTLEDHNKFAKKRKYLTWMMAVSMLVAGFAFSGLIAMHTMPMSLSLGVLSLGVTTSMLTTLLVFNSWTTERHDIMREGMAMLKAPTGKHYVYRNDQITKESDETESNNTSG